MVGCWVHVPGLPARWVTREISGVRQFRGADNQIFPTFSHAYDHLYQNKSKFETKQITSFFSSFKQYSHQTVLQQQHQQSSTQNNAAKQGRKSNITKRRKNDEAFMKLKQLVENKASDDKISAALEELKAYGWYEDPRLPEGWLKFNPIKQSVQYLVYKPFVMKFISKQSALTHLKYRASQSAQLVSREYLVKFVIGDSDIDHQMNTEHDDDWEEGHESVPPEWKIRRNRETQQTEILSPENICFKDRVTVMKFMTSDLGKNIFNSNDVEVLRAKLSFEGFNPSVSLPEGWMINRTESLSKFLTKDCQILSNRNSILDYISDTSKMSGHERKHFMLSLSSLSFNKTPAKLAAVVLKSDLNVSRPAPVLPGGWSCEHLSDKLIKITSDEGEVFYSRLQALEFMIENDVADELVYELWKTLDQEDWIFGCNYVPEAWGVRKLDSNVLFLSKELVVLTSVDEALDYIENEDDYEPKDFKVLNDWKEVYITANWIEDPLLPSGWRKTEMRTELEEEESQTEHFLAPDTSIFSGRVALLEQLIQTNHSLDTIYTLWTTLDSESWMLDSQQVILDPANIFLILRDYLVRLMSKHDEKIR